MTSDARETINQARRVLADIGEPVRDHLPQLSLATAYLRRALDQLEELRVDAVRKT